MFREQLEIQSPGCRTRSAEDKGLGVFASRIFDAGETVILGSVLRPAVENDSHAVQVGPSLFAHEEGIGALVNHSCDPNCVMRFKRHGLCDVVARRTIWHGHEITIDYALRNYVIEFFPYPCRCGTQACRGSITGWKDLPSNLRMMYRGYVAPFILELEKDESAALMGGRTYS